jgi:elongation factor 1-beta
MGKLEEAVRSVEQEGLVWGASTLVAVGYGVKKLQITLVIGRIFVFFCHSNYAEAFYAEDDLVSLDELQEKIQEFEDYVQSTDVAAMQSA